MFSLSWHDEGAIGSIRLDRPPANAIGLDQARELDGLLHEVAEQETCRALIFHAKGRFFSAGADIALMGELAGKPEAAAALCDLARVMQETYARVASLPVPTLCAISGICVGGGLELALACDIRIAERDARLGLPEARIGLLPGAGGTQRLTAVAGVAVARRLILTGDIISAATAQGFGIVQDVVETAEAFGHALGMARAIAAVPRRTVEAIERCLALAPSPAGYAAEIEESAVLHDQAETKALIAAFLARSKSKKAEVV